MSKYNWEFSYEKINQFPKSIGVSWLFFRTEVTRLQKQEGIKKNPISFVYIKLHWFSKLYYFSWQKKDE